MKTLLLALSLAASLAASPSFAQAVSGFGGFKPLPEAGEQADPSRVYRVIFDVSQGGADDRPLKGLDRVARLVNMLAAGGVDADRATQGQRVWPVARLHIRRDRLLEDTLSGFAPLGSLAKGRVAVTFVNAAGQEEDRGAEQAAEQGGVDIEALSDEEPDAERARHAAGEPAAKPRGESGRLPDQSRLRGRG